MSLPDDRPGAFVSRLPPTSRPTTDDGGDQWVEWNELAVGLNASLLTPERTTMQRIEAIWHMGAGDGLRNMARSG